MSNNQKNLEDGTGRARLVRNVLASWGGHLIFIVAGFVLPRLIDRQLGQTALGIWDFGWSIVSYFGITQVGIGSSINRFVATYRPVQDTDKLNGVVSSAMCMQLVAALVTMALTIVAVESLPFFFQARLGEYLDEAWWVVLFLGIGLGIQIAFDSFQGVITGCHRWDLHHAINSGFYGLTVLMMATALLFGGGLQGLALANLTGVILTEITRAIVAYRVCPELKLRWQYFNWPQASEIFEFGIKIVLGSLSMLLVYQTTSLLIVKYLGAGALAVFARALALVRHCSVFVDKFASILTPTASSMQADGQRDELKTFLLQTAQYSMAMALPPVLLLAILGGTVLRLWMGAGYAHGEVLAILALGHLMTIAQSPLWTILRGVNKHGWPAVTRLASALVCVILNWLVLSNDHPTLVGTALAVTIPLTIVDGVYLPWYATRELGVPLLHYVKYAWGQPLLCILPFSLILVAVDHAFAEQPIVALLWGSLIGGISLLVIYWYWVFPHTVRDKVRQKLRGLQRSALRPLRASNG